MWTVLFLGIFAGSYVLLIQIESYASNEPRIGKIRTVIGSLLTNHGFYFAVMRRTPAAGILEYIISLLYFPFFTIWVSATKQASDTHKLFMAWVSATKQASDTHKLFIVWVSATKQASDTHKLFIVWVSATKQASHTLKLSTAWVSATKQASDTHKLFIAWVSATKQASHTHKLFTLRRKKGTEKLDPISCAHTEAKEGYREACSCLLCPR